MKRVVLVTGCSAGIGLATVKRFINKGDIVYGLSRNNFQLNGLKHILCDITDENCCVEAIRQIIDKEGRLDVLVNNAGFGIAGAVETTTLIDARKIFDVNFFGTFNMIKASLSFLRLSKGKIINISSVAGKLSIPFQTFYSATKSALDAFAAGVRAEVKTFKVQICNILPGDVKTDFTKNRTKSENGIYEERFQKSISRMEFDEQNGMSPDAVAKVVIKCASKKKMPPQKVVGFKYKMFVFLAKILPIKFVEFIVSLLYA